MISGFITHIIPTLQHLSNPLFSAPPDFTLCLGPLMVFLATAEIDNIFQGGTEWIGGHLVRGQEK